MISSWSTNESASNSSELISDSTHFCFHLWKWQVITSEHNLHFYPYTALSPNMLPLSVGRVFVVFWRWILERILRSTWRVLAFTEQNKSTRQWLNVFKYHYHSWNESQGWAEQDSWVWHPMISVLEMQGTNVFWIAHSTHTDSFTINVTKQII